MTERPRPEDETHLHPTDRRILTDQLNRENGRGVNIVGGNWPVVETPGAGRSVIENNRTDVKQETSVDHPVREAILSHLESFPGTNLHSLCNALDANRGTAVHHLNVLKQRRQIVSIQSGRERHFFLPGTIGRYKDLWGVLRTGRAMELAKAVMQRPGEAQGTIARQITMTRKVFRKHMNRFLDHGLVQEQASGRSLHYYPTPALMEAITFQASLSTEPDGTATNAVFLPTSDACPATTPCTKSESKTMQPQKTCSALGDSRTGSMSALTQQNYVYSALSQTRLGVGLGYRSPLHQQILAKRHELDFLEIVSDSFFRNEKLLKALTSLIPCLPHSVNLSVGSTLADEYLQKLERILKITNPPWHSDHLAFTRAGELQVGHLAPIAYTEESLQRVVENVRRVQSHLKVPFALENITMPFYWPNNEIEEHDFLIEVTNRTGCHLLLDLENVRINQKNHGLGGHRFLDHLPLERVVQVHIAGGVQRQGLEHDTHSASVPEPTWQLLEHLCSLVSPPAILLERDADFASFAGLLQDVQRAKRTWEKSQR